YTLSSKVWDSSCVMGKLVCDYAWPKAFSYGEKTFDEEKFTYYDDGTETKREVVKSTAKRPALETYMGYIIYDDRGILYLINPDGGVMTKYDDTAYIPAYARDKQGRPLFYRPYTATVQYPTQLSEADENGNRQWLNYAEMKVDSRKYYYLSENGQYFIESDYNDATDNRGLYFDYPAYYGNTDSNLNRYYFNTTAVVTSLKNETGILNRMSWMYSVTPVKLNELKFDKDGKNLSDPNGKTFEQMFPYTMAYNYSENYAAVKMDIKWDYDHEIDDGYGGKKNEYVQVTSNELRVVDKTGKVMFSSRKNYFSELGWTANERYVDPLSLGIDSIGSYYFDNGLMRLRVQSYDRYYFTDLDMVFIVTDEDILVRPDGKEFTVPSGYKLKAYSNGILLLEKDGKYSYYKSNGTWLREMEFTDAETFLEGIAVCALNGKYGVINNSGNVVVPFEYDYISTVSSGTVTAYKNGEGWTVFQKLSK
ncbi:MAG: WG repeat-containing protein, partial [Clostridia bacterium]|nr:WG repeat-containing protein [Clostridia bacterium]